MRYSSVISKRKDNWTQTENASSDMKRIDPRSLMKERRSRLVEDILLWTLTSRNDPDLELVTPPSQTRPRLVQLPRYSTTVVVARLIVAGITGLSRMVPNRNQHFFSPNAAASAISIVAMVICGLWERLRLLHWAKENGEQGWKVKRVRIIGERKSGDVVQLRYERGGWKLSVFELSSRMCEGIP